MTKKKFHCKHRYAWGINISNKNHSILNYFFVLYHHCFLFFQSKTYKQKKKMSQKDIKGPIDTINDYVTYVRTRNTKFLFS